MSIDGFLERGLYWKMKRNMVKEYNMAIDGYPGKIIFKIEMEYEK